MGKVAPVALGILAGLAACLACALLVAISVAIVDLYLAGHNLPTLTRPWVDHGPFRFSRADALMNACALVAGVATGVLVAKSLRRGDRAPSGRGSGPTRARQS